MTSFSDLYFFCDHIIRNYGSPHLLSEEQKADEFRSVYLRNLPINLRTLKAVASACGVNLNGLEWDKMPDTMRGYHEVYDGRRNIYYKKGDTISGIENTILHETREMMETVFVELHPDTYEPLKTIARHLAANRFASAVLLPRDTFEAKVYETGLDVVALAELYWKSCSQVLLRVGEILGRKLFFYAALYENTSQSKPDWKVTYWTDGRNEECPENNIHGFYGFFPRKGHQVVPGALVDMAINTGRAHLVRHITILDDVDDMEDNGLIALAQPLVISGTAPSKVALVVLLECDRQKLAPQIERTKPVVIDSFHKHL